MKKMIKVAMIFLLGFGCKAAEVFIEGEEKSCLPYPALSEDLLGIVFEIEDYKLIKKGALARLKNQEKKLSASFLDFLGCQDQGLASANELVYLLNFIKGEGEVKKVLDDVLKKNPEVYDQSFKNLKDCYYFLKDLKLLKKKFCILHEQLGVLKINKQQPYLDIFIKSFNNLVFYYNKNIANSWLPGFSTEKTSAEVKIILHDIAFFKRTIEELRRGP